MSFNDLHLPLQKVIDLGEVDRWLRGMTQVVPRSIYKKSPEDGIELDVHTFPFGKATVDKGEIERMIGFRQLIAAASGKNVRIDMAIDESGLEVSFQADKTFSESQLFGASYANVLPVLFMDRRKK